jgi:hypothetical protein
LFAADGDHEAAVAQGDERLLDHVGEARLFEESFQAALDGVFEVGGALAQGMEGGAGAIEYGTGGIEAPVQVGGERCAEVGPGRQGAQGGSGLTGFTAEEGGDLGGGIEEPAHEEQFRAIEHGAFGSRAPEGCFRVVEKHPWEGGSGVKDGEDVGIEVGAGQIVRGAQGGPDGLDEGATAGRLSVAADGVEEGTELEDSKGVWVHQRRGL